MGGAIREKAYSNKIHKLDLKRGVWYELEGTLPAGRCGRMNGILVGDKVYLGVSYSPYVDSSELRFADGRMAAIV